MSVDRQLFEAMRTNAEFCAFIDSMTPEKSRECAQELIKEVAERQRISEIEAMGILAPLWKTHSEMAQDVWPALAEHLKIAYKMCD